MKKVLFTLMCMAAMMAAGTGLKAQEVTIVLNPGWTWISYPSTDTVDIATAFGSFTPAIGDIFKSKWGMATYIGNGQWRGAISPVFYPGYGYHYKSNRQMPVVVTVNVQQPAPSVVVTTSEPLLITAISAMCGGEVTVNDGTYIIVKGLCWAAHENPTTNDDFYQEAESGVGSFSISMTGLNISTTYYVRAYAVTANGTVYGDQKTFTTRDGIPTLTTAEVTYTQGSTANCGGNITDNGGLNITARGVCWSTSPNPTVNDNHTSNGTGVGSFTSSITGLDISTTYYIRAYATTNAGTAYGNELNFATIEYVYVDLGLPSGLLWATCNVGANTPEEYGDYFAWGETQPKNSYNWSTYQHCNGDESSLTKYSIEYWDWGILGYTNYGYNGFIDNLTTLLPEDDAASVNWGNGWRMPTKKEWQELRSNTTITWTNQNGVNGRLFTANNGNSIFLPAAGSRNGNSIYNVDSYGDYWSSSLYTDDIPRDAWAVRFGSDGYYFAYDSRCCGQSVRAVNTSSLNTFIINASIPVAGGTISGAGTYIYGTSCTLTATADEGYTFAHWAVNGEVVSTNATYTFTVSADRTLEAYFTKIGADDHVYVDLGLPSGTLWATCNVGAFAPENSGYAFAWGETIMKDDYSWFNYQYSNDPYYYDDEYELNPCLTKYCNQSWYGDDGFTDNLTTLQLEDDVALSQWGSRWRMPTKDEWQELLDNTTSTLTTQNGRNGYLFTSTNGNSLFLPSGDYWSSSLNTSRPDRAWELQLYSSSCTIGSSNRCYGEYIRAVRSGYQNTYVDLGLPSGLLWATCNVGANTSEECGDYFAWGETGIKDSYSWNTYDYCNGSSTTMTKYCSNSSYGYNGFTDNLTTLLPEDDAATANLSDGWRMPTRTEWQELRNNTTETWTTQNGVKGRLFTASNGNFIFLPAAGYRNGSSLDDADCYGYYWSSTLYTGAPHSAWNFYFGSGNYNMDTNRRYYGFPVRPVCSLRQN